MVKLVRGENDLPTLYPDLVNEWHPTKNGDLMPEDISSGSGKEVWWVCPKGHTYSMVVNQRTKRGYGCPYCSGRRAIRGINDLATTNPELSEEWNYEKNINLTPYDVTAGSHKKVWWLCEKGHSYEQFIIKRANRGYSCPYCSGHKVLRGFNDLAMEMSRNVQSGNTQNLKSMVIQRRFPKWSVAERRKTAAASDQAAVCACAHSRYFTGGSPSGLRV